MILYKLSLYSWLTNNRFLSAQKATGEKKPRMPGLEWPGFHPRSQTCSLHRDPSCSLRLVDTCRGWRERIVLKPFWGEKGRHRKGKDPEWEIGRHAHNTEPIPGEKRKTQKGQRSWMRLRKNKTNVATRCEEADFGGPWATKSENQNYRVHSGMTGEIWAPNGYQMVLGCTELPFLNIWQIVAVDNAGCHEVWGGVYRLVSTTHF